MKITVKELKKRLESAKDDDEVSVLEIMSDGSVFSMKIMYTQTDAQGFHIYT